MKTIEQIAADCGIEDGSPLECLKRFLEGRESAEEFIYADIVGALYWRIDSLEDELAALGPITTGGHIITATKESTGYLINIQQANAECPTFVAEVLVEAFDGEPAVHIYDEMDEAPTQTIRL